MYETRQRIAMFLVGVFTWYIGINTTAFLLEHGNMCTSNISNISQYLAKSRTITGSFHVAFRTEGRFEAYVLYSGTITVAMQP